MNLLIVEDNPGKAAEVRSLVSQVKPDTQIAISGSMSDVVRVMDQIRFDLVILDFMLPIHDGGPPHDCSRELLGVANSSSRNSNTCLVALTAYDDLVNNATDDFFESGVIICKYSAHDPSWRPTIRSLIERHSSRSARRFVIICALESERKAFEYTPARLGEAKTIGGLDASDIEIGNELGVAVLSPRMGLVNACSVTALAVERFSPEIVCMAGICAGISGRSEIGQVLVANPCFEYQVGKYTPTGFDIEPYQISLSEDLRQKLKRLNSDTDLIEALYQDLGPTPVSRSSPEFSVFVSGSAVVADQKVVKAITSQHRKVSGLDMEAFGVMQAAALSDLEVDFFSAKAVVDHADSAKSDAHQADGCKVSARYCVAALSMLLDDAAA